MEPQGSHRATPAARGRGRRARAHVLAHPGRPAAHTAQEHPPARRGVAPLRTPRSARLDAPRTRPRARATLAVPRRPPERLPRRRAARPPAAPGRPPCTPARGPQAAGRRRQGRLQPGERARRRRRGRASSQAPAFSAPMRPHSAAARSRRSRRAARSCARSAHAAAAQHTAATRSAARPCVSARVRPGAAAGAGAGARSAYIEALSAAAAGAAGHGRAERGHRVLQPQPRRARRARARGARPGRAWAAARARRAWRARARGARPGLARRARSGRARRAQTARRRRQRRRPGPPWPARGRGVSPAHGDAHPTAGLALHTRREGFQRARGFHAKAARVVRSCPTQCAARGSRRLSRARVEAEAASRRRGGCQACALRNQSARAVRTAGAWHCPVRERVQSNEQRRSVQARWDTYAQRSARWRQRIRRACRMRDDTTHSRCAWARPPAPFAPAVARRCLWSVDADREHARRLAGAWLRAAPPAPRARSAPHPPAAVRPRRLQAPNVARARPAPLLRATGAGAHRGAARGAHARGRLNAASVRHPCRPRAPGTAVQGARASARARRTGARARTGARRPSAAALWRAVTARARVPALLRSLLATRQRAGRRSAAPGARAGA
jgi:hypothetical protein